MNTSKYAGKTIIQIAQERGSAAKTKTGAWKYLLANLGRTLRGIYHIEHPVDRRRWGGNFLRIDWPCHTDSYGSYGPRLDSDWTNYRQARMDRRADGRALILGHSLTDPTTPGRIRAEAWEMNRKWDADCRISIERGNYGAIYRNANAAPAERPRPEVARWDAAWDLIRRAAQNGTIPDRYDTIDFDRKGRAEGSALHHELYDFAPRAAIVCIRRTEGTRYGVKTLSKSYMLIESYRRKITARVITIPVSKYAKMPILHYGDMIDIARGKKRIILQTPGMLANKQAREIAKQEAAMIHQGYKIVRRNSDGTYASVWDNSAWEIGRERVEPVYDDHRGGLYYYRDLTAAITAAAQSEVFGADKNHHRLAILAVEATGPTIRYNEKYAAERITPTQDIGSTI